LLKEYIGQPHLTEAREAGEDSTSSGFSSPPLTNAEVTELRGLLHSEWRTSPSGGGDPHHTGSAGVGSSSFSSPHAGGSENIDGRVRLIERFFLVQPALLSLLVDLFRKREKLQEDYPPQDRDADSLSGATAFVLEVADVQLRLLQRLLAIGDLSTVDSLLPHIYVHHDVNFKRYESFVTSMLSNPDSCTERVFQALCANGSLPMIRLAESAEDKRLLSLHPDGLMVYLMQQVEQGKEISPNDTVLIKLTRLHNENLYLCVIQMAINIIASGRDVAKAKEILKNVPELHSIFLVLFWDSVVDQQESKLTLQDLKQVFDAFEQEEGEEQKASNTTSKIVNLLKHHLNLTSKIAADDQGGGRQQSFDPMSMLKEMNSKSIAQMLSDVDAYNEEILDFAEESPTYNYQQKVLLQHDLNVYHVRGFIFAFFKAFSLTNISVANGQADELEGLLTRMRDHVRKSTCSFSLTWMAWFCYVFFNCRYNENISNWRSVGSDFFKANLANRRNSSANEGEGISSKYAVKLFEAVIALVEESISSTASIDEEYISYVLGSAGRESDLQSVKKVFAGIVDDRKSALHTFVDQARWRLDIVTKIFSSESKNTFASWPEIFKILHATPTSLLQICKSYNQYNLCDETVKRYSISDAEASSVQLAEWIDGLSTRVSVDGMINQMSMHSQPEEGIEALHKSAVDDFESYVKSCKMDEMDKVLLHLDVGAAVAPSENISTRMFANAKLIMEDRAKSDQTETPEDKIILNLCNEVLGALSAAVSNVEIPTIPKLVSSVDILKNGPDLGQHAKAVQMLLEALKIAEEGKKQFLSGVLHNICRALSSDGSVKSESFKGRLQSTGLGLQKLQEKSQGGDEGLQHWQYVSTFISYLAHIGDAIASVDNQDTYNHFNLLTRDPKDILMYVLFERKNPEIAARIAKLLHTNLIDEVLKACVPQIYPPLSGKSSSEEKEAISKHDWAKNILVLKSLVEKSPLRIALACLYISYRSSEQENDILSFALEQLSAYPILHRWIKIQFFIQQMKNRITKDESSGSNSTILETGFEHEHTSGALEGCLWEDLHVYRIAIERMMRNGKLQEALLLSDKCFEDGSSDSLLCEMVEVEEKESKWNNIFLLALRIQNAEKLWQTLQRFKSKWSLEDVILVALKCKSIAEAGSKVHSLALTLCTQLGLYKRILVADGAYNGKWLDVENVCKNSPESLLKRLSVLGAHQLVSDIASEFECIDATLRELEGEAMLACLSEKSVDGGGICGVKRKLASMDAPRSLAVAFFALRGANNIALKKIFLSYILPEENKQILNSTFPADHLAYVSQVKIGIDILSHLPDPLASKYERLVERPELILENLIISLEIPLAKTICLLYPKLLSNDTLSFYSYKACCFDRNEQQEEGAEVNIQDSDASSLQRRGKGNVFPLLTGESGDDSIRDSYYYGIAPSVPLCESILGLSMLPELAALNCTRVAIELSLDFLNQDLEKKDDVSLVSILSDLERTETVLEIIEKAQEYFESTFSEKGIEFNGWESIWDAGLSSKNVYNFDLCRYYEKLVALLDPGTTPPDNLQTFLVDVTNFAVRLNLIHTLLSHDIPVSFTDFATKSSIEEMIEYIKEEEHYNIAIFVSNKFGLDPSGVWESWGTGLLNLSEFTEARIKIDRAIKTSVPFSGNEKQAQIAMHAVEILEKGQMLKVSDIYDLTHKALQEKDVKAKGGWFNLLGPGKNPQKSSTGTPLLEDNVYSECIYYLKKFAPDNLLEFYFKHEQYKKACQFAIEKNSRSSIEALSKACIHFQKEDLLTSFFEAELNRDSDDKESVLLLLRHAVTFACQQERFALAYHLQLLDCKGLLAAVLALRSFKDSYSREDADRWLQKSMDQILQVSGQSHENNFVSLGIQSDDLGVSNVLELRSIISLQADVMKHAEKQGTDFKSWDIVGNGDMISFHRRRAAELILLKDGNLAFRIIQEFRLQATEVYIDSIRHFCKSNKKHIGSLIGMVKDLKGTLGDGDWDHVIGSAFFVLLNECSDRARAKQMMKLLISDHSKILAFIALGKLEKAFDLAVSCADEVDVKLIKKHAQGTKINQDLVRKCEEYLRNHSRLGKTEVI
jgi:hypothetical protein